MICMWLLETKFDSPNTSILITNRSMHDIATIDDSTTKPFFNSLFPASKMNVSAGSKNFADVAVIFASICFLLVSQLFLRAGASASVDCNPLTGCCRGPNDPPCTWFLKISFLISSFWFDRLLRLINSVCFCSGCLFLYSFVFVLF